MKNSKKLKLILHILICILISLIGIVGIYTQSTNRYKDLLPEYILGSDISGITVLEFEVDHSKDTVYYDKEGKEVDSSTITEENKDKYETKEIPVNAEENLKLENYKQVVQIMEKRLKLLGTNQYQIDMDEETGKIVISVEDEYIQDIESILPMEGKLQLIDSNTGDVVIDYTDFISAETSYASLTSEVRTYISLKLNDSGIEKFNNTDKYKVVENSEKDDKETKESKLIVQFDADKITEVSYNDILLNGKTLRITTASGLTSDSEINSELNMNAMVTKLSTIGKMPVIYNISPEEFMKNDLPISINYAVILLSAICVIISLIVIFKYKFKGLLTVLGFAANISIFLIIIRITKIQISLNGFAGMIGLIFLNMILINNILKCINSKEKTFSENVKKAYLNSANAVVVMLIIFVIFAFSSMTLINTMGLLLFWGWLVTVLGTLIFTVPMLSIVTQK